MISGIALAPPDFRPIRLSKRREACELRHGRVSGQMRAPLAIELHFMQAQELRRANIVHRRLTRGGDLSCEQRV